MDATKRQGLLAGLTAAGLALAGCDGTGAPLAPERNNREVQSHVALSAAQSCQQLEQTIEDTAVSEMKAQLAQIRDRSGGGWWWWGPPMMESGTAADGAAPNAAPGPTDYTTTNTQVGGVDEADFVKNDGTRIFVISRDRLLISQSWPVESMGLKSTVQIEGWPQEMFLNGSNRVVVFSSVWEPLYPEDGNRASGASSMDLAYYYATTTKVTTVDVSDLSAPRVVGEVYLPGHYGSSRRIDNQIRLVLRDEFRFPVGVKYYPDYDEGLWKDENRWKAEIDRLIVANEKIIRAKTLEQWLPRGARKLADGTRVPVDYACTDFHLSNAPSRLGLATVATLDMNAPDAAVKRTAVVGEVGEIYASKDALYIASPHWWWWPQIGQTDTTYLHKFDISNPNHASYLASGTVPGYVNDQFSLDEKDGFLRVATTITERQADPQNPDNTWGITVTKNRVTVLEQRGSQLAIKGATPDLAPGERIFASRFMGNRGFMVTFRQVDPLFTLDLTDPANPRVLGELKIPGFSTYLHPVDENHLLGIGEDRDDTGNWMSRSLKVSLYDVTDLSRPVEKFKYLLGSNNSYSEASHQHKAFNYFAAKKTLAIPFSDYSWGGGGGSYWNSFVSELRVLKVDTATGITAKGSLAFDDLYMSYGDSSWRYYYQPWVRRSVMADDYVYAISDAGIRVAHVDSLSTPISTVDFTNIWSQP